MRDEEQHNRIAEMVGRTWRMVDTAVGEGYDAVEIAGALCSAAMTLYKTALDADGYDSMIEAVYDNRDRVKSLRDWRDPLNQRMN